jgi:hypothetical protein
MRTGRWWPRELPGVFIRLAGVAVCGGDDGHIRGAVSRAVVSINNAMMVADSTAGAG